MAVIQDFIIRLKTQGAEGLRGLKGDIADLASSINPLSGSLPGLARGLGGLAGPIGLIGGAFAFAGIKAVQLADQIQDLSNATNISAGTLISFKNSVIEAGGSADDYQKLVTKLNQSVQEAAGGNAQLQKSFQTLGVYVRDAEGNIRSTDDILGELTTKFRQGTVTGAQYSAAVDLLGKGLAKLDITQLSAIKDPVADADIKRLADYTTAIDAIRARLERGLLSFFGSVAEQAENAFSRIEKSQKRFAEEQKRLAQQGLKYETDLQGEMLIVPMTKKERAEFEVRNPVGITGGIATSKGRRGGAGDFGGDSDEVLKARAESAKRISESVANTESELKKKALAKEIQGLRINEAMKLSMAGENLDKVSQLRAAADEKTFSNYVRQLEQEKEIAINLKRDIEKATTEINSKEHLNAKEKAGELAQITKELRTKAENDVQTIRNSAELQSYDIKRQLEKDLTTFRIENEKKIFEISQAGIAAQVDEYKNLIDLQTQEKRQIDDTLKGMREQTQEMKDRYGIMVLQNRGNFNSIELTAIEEGTRLIRQYNKELEKINNTPFLTDDEKNSRVEKLNEILNEQSQLVNEIAQAETDRQNSFGAGVQDQIKQYKESITAFKIGGQMVDSVYGNMMSALERFVKQGKFSFKDFANSVILDLVMIEARANATRLFTSLFSFGGSSVPGRALGGPVLPNQPYIVGEKGPEIFLPNAAGNIIPNNKLGSSGSFGSGASVTYNINAVDAPSFRQMIAKDPSFLYAVTEQGRKSIPSTRR
jgi:lambda family phage tail tape measure protein